jgi:hypothetical protein
MYEPPTPTPKEATRWLTYLESEGFIIIHAYEVPENEDTLVVFSFDGGRRFTLPYDVIFNIFRLVVTGGYQSLLTSMRDALYYFKKYDSDYLITVLSHMQNENVGPDKQLAMMLCYYGRSYSRKITIKQMLMEIEQSI